MRISIIIPAFNVAAWLPRCLDSLLAQTHSNIEIIVVNDGSRDETAVIMDEYAARDSRIRAIHKENGGVTSARLRGVAEASGQWIGFVDGDDWVEPSMFARLLERAREYGADISHCGYRMCFADGRVHYFHNSGIIEKQDTVTALRELLSGERIEPGLCNKIFRRELFYGLLQEEVMDRDIRINEDLLMNYYLFKQARNSVFEDWCPYHYVVRDSSASRAKLNEHKLYDPIRVKEIILADADEVLREDARRAYINTCINTYHALLPAGPEYRVDRKAVRKRLRREKEAFSLLGRKRELMARMIVGMPVLYRPVYQFYCLFLQKKVYS